MSIWFVVLDGPWIGSRKGRAYPTRGQIESSPSQSMWLNELTVKKIKLQATQLPTMAAHSCLHLHRQLATHVLYKKKKWANSDQLKLSSHALVNFRFMRSARQTNLLLGSSLSSSRNPWAEFWWIEPTSRPTIQTFCHL